MDGRGARHGGGCFCGRRVVAIVGAKTNPIARSFGATADTKKAEVLIGNFSLIC